MVRHSMNRPTPLTEKMKAYATKIAKPISRYLLLAVSSFLISQNMSLFPPDIVKHQILDRRPLEDRPFAQ